ncbi:hypothetical protein J4Q44_G00064940 [Coregonus suidteri]|uniref:Uncharacterized protein n=1 Tax=Coregonus suidteri TaxID=861788 RepID=A0AAN8R0V3_9TELE
MAMADIGEDQDYLNEVMREEMEDVFIYDGLNAVPSLGTDAEENSSPVIGMVAGPRLGTDTFRSSCSKTGLYVVPTLGTDTEVVSNLVDGMVAGS